MGNAVPDAERRSRLDRAWPIRWFLYLLVIATAAPLCLHIAAGLVRHASDAEREAEQLVLSLAGTAAATARSRLRETEVVARALSARSLVRALDPARCDPLLEGLLPVLPHYANISVVAPDGRFVCSALPVQSGAQAAPLHEGIQAALEDRFGVSAPMIGVLPPRLLVSTAYPIRNGAGQIAGVLTMPFDLAALQPVNDAPALPRNARVRLIDKRGVLLASSIRNDPELGRVLRGADLVERVLVGESGTGRAQGNDGTLRIYGYTAVGSHGWRAYASVPASELLEAARRRTLASAAIAAGLLALALGAAALVSRRIVGPASAMQHAMDETAAGRLTSAREAGPRELRALAANYNRMLDATLRARAALHESEARLQLAVRASHTGLWDWDMITDRVYFSPEWKRQLGLDDGEVGDTGAEWSERLHPAERERVLKDLEALAASERSEYEAEFRLRHRDGSHRWIYSRAEIIRDEAGRPQRMLGTHIDITPRKLLEQTLTTTVAELRVLSMRLLEVEEAERRRIGRELHDRTGASVAALHINLGLVAERLASGLTDQAAALVDDARAVLREVSTEIRTVMAELRPAALDDFGLYPALLSYAREVAERIGAELKTTGGATLKRPPSVVETALFRIAQEALTNIAKHAHAATVELGLEERERELVLTVADDGAGFDVSAGGAGHGMRTMRERADAIRAKLVVQSTPGAGTRIRVEVPRS